MTRLWFWCPARQRQVHVEATRTAFRDVLLQEVKIEACLYYRIHGCGKRLDGACLVGKRVQGRFSEASSS